MLIMRRSEQRGFCVAHNSALCSFTDHRLWLGRQHQAFNEATTNGGCERPAQCGEKAGWAIAEPGLAPRKRQRRVRNLNGARASLPVFGSLAGPQVGSGLAQRGGCCLSCKWRDGHSDSSTLQKLLEFSPAYADTVYSSSTMCGRSNEAVLRGGFSLYSCNTRHIPFATYAACGVAPPDRPSRAKCIHPDPPESPDSFLAQTISKCASLFYAGLTKP